MRSLREQGLKIVGDTPRSRHRSTAHRALLQLPAGLLEQRRRVRLPPIGKVQSTGYQGDCADSTAENANQMENGTTGSGCLQL